MSGNSLANLALAVLVVLPAVFPETAIGVAAPASRALSYALDVTFIPEKSSLEGTARIMLSDVPTACDTLDLYLHGELQFTGASCGGVELDGSQDLVFYGSDYSSVARRLRLVVAGADLSRGLDIAWRGPMHPSTARALSNYMRIDADGVFLRSYGYSVWFPLLLADGQESYPVDFDPVVLRTPSDMKPVFTGTRLDEHLDEDQRVTTWRAKGMDIFSAQCTARPYREIVAGPLHIYHLPDPESAEAADHVLDLVRRLLDFYAENYRHGVAVGELHVAQLCRFGNISSGNMVGLADDSWAGFEPGSYSGLTLAHELVHPFVRVPVPESSPLYALFVEGFPSYCHLPALASFLGDGWYNEIMDGIASGYARKRATGKDRRGRTLPPATPFLEMTPKDIGTYKDWYLFPDRLRLYFDDLRRRLGDEEFLDLVGEIVNQDTLDPAGLRRIVVRHLPEFGAMHDRWLATNDFDAGMGRQ